jgi:hypothetical protein
MADRDPVPVVPSDHTESEDVDPITSTFKNAKVYRSQDLRTHDGSQYHEDHMAKAVIQSCVQDIQPLLDQYVPRNRPDKPEMSSYSIVSSVDGHYRSQMKVVITVKYNLPTVPSEYKWNRPQGAMVLFNGLPYRAGPFPLEICEIIDRHCYFRFISMSASYTTAYHKDRTGDRYITIPCDQPSIRVDRHEWLIGQYRHRDFGQPALRLPTGTLEWSHRGTIHRFPHPDRPMIPLPAVISANTPTIFFVHSGQYIAEIQLDHNNMVRRMDILNGSPYGNKTRSCHYPKDARPTLEELSAQIRVLMFCDACRGGDRKRKRQEIYDANNPVF